MKKKFLTLTFLLFTFTFLLFTSPLQSQDFTQPRTALTDSIIGNPVKMFRIWKYEECTPVLGSGIRTTGYLRKIVISGSDTIGDLKKTFVNNLYYSDTLYYQGNPYPISQVPRYFYNTDGNNLNGWDMQLIFVSEIIKQHPQRWTY